MRPSPVFHAHDLFVLKYCSSFVDCELAFICRVYAYMADYGSKCLRNEITIGQEVDVLQVEVE